MTDDVRISCALPGHPKTKKLKKRLGADGVLSLVWLFVWAAQNKPSGDLSGMSDEDIEIACDWSGEPGALVSALCEVRFMDGCENARSLHDWSEHNPWASGHAMRAAKARWNAIKGHHGIAAADREVPEYAAVRKATSKETASEQHASSMLVADYQQATGNAQSSAPSPSPSPSPSPKAEEHVEGPSDLLASAPATAVADCPYLEIIEAYHEALPMLPQVRVHTEQRRQVVRRHWRSDPEKQDVEWWRRFFGYVARSDFLTGRKGDWHGCCFDWLLKPANFAKTIEGNYENRGQE